MKSKLLLSILTFAVMATTLVSCTSGPRRSSGQTGAMSSFQRSRM